MGLACFSAKNVFLAFMFTVATLFLCLNIIISLGWSSIRISDISTHSLHLNLILKTDDVLPFNVYKTVLEVTQCYDRPLKPFVAQRGDFWVFYNYIRAEKQHRCFESVTYTTQGDYTFLDNLIPLMERWRGPISVALHAPGDDFQPTLDSVAYLRNCGNSLIKQYATFHFFFGTSHVPEGSSLKPLSIMYEDTYNCSQGAPYENRDYKVLYKTKANLTYPINVARNIARSSAQTHFVLASDIELYPTPNVISKFLRMVAHRRELFEDPHPKVFVLPVFEVLENESVPENKTTLLEMIESEKAFSFHKHICLQCHEIPNATSWLKLPEDDDLNIFMKAKRYGRQIKWEAFYIGTRTDPPFDERLTWEGQSNKMTQAYALCLLNYDYMVLDNAFMVHKPGVKKHKIQLRKYSKLVWATNKFIRKDIKNEMHSIFGGPRSGCK